MNKHLISLLLVAISATAQAEQIISQAQQQITTTQEQIAQEAKRWELTSTEYQQYLDLMKNTPAGEWYKELDPSEVLGIQAKTEAERERYARLAVKMEHNRAARELAFQQAFSKAFATLYPTEKPIGGGEDYTTITNLAAGDELLLFTSLESQSGQFLASKLLAVIQENPAVQLNVYITGAVNRAAIEKWARDNQIPVNLVSSGRVTLNYDQGRLRKMMGKETSLPQVLRGRAGTFKPISLNSI